MTMEPAKPIGIGQQLQQRRQELGLTIEQVAARTRIRKAYLLDLEADRFGELPGDAYVKGFLRNYAKCLQMPAEALVECYRDGGGDERSSEPAPEQSAASHRTVGDTRPTGSWTGFWVAFVVILLLGGGFYLLIGMFEAPVEQVPAVSAGATPPIAGAPPVAAAVDATVAVAAPAATSAETPWPTIPAGGANVRVLGLGDGLLTVDIDGQPAQHYSLQDGAVLSWFVKDSIHLQTTTPGQFRCWLEDEELVVADRTEWRLLTLPAGEG